MSKRPVNAHGYASRTLWEEATREVPSAWLEDEARSSSSPHSLLASWKGPRGVPSHVMIKLLRRRLREHYPESMEIPLPAARLQRARDMLEEIWARTGKGAGKHPTWRLVEGLLRWARDQYGAGPGGP